MIAPRAAVDPTKMCRGLPRDLRDVIHAEVPSSSLPPALTCRDVLRRRFHSDFEGSNLRAALARSPTEYELQLSSDLASSHVQWFYWRVTGMMANVTYTFHVINFVKPTSVFEEHTQPVMLSSRRFTVDGTGWTREGHDIAYYTNGADLISGKRIHTLSFSITFPYTDDSVYIAHFFPYVYSDLQTDLLRWRGTCGGGQNGGAKTAKALEATQEVADQVQTFCTEYRTLLCTPGSLHLDVLRIGASHDAKPMIVLAARAHPGEAPSSWVMRGACDFLFLDSGEEARACRSASNWLVVPMLNPDGVVAGNTRTNLAGVDLNRHHHDDTAPEIVAFRALFAEATGCNKPVFAFIDIHGHSRRRGIFLMGNAGASSRLLHLLSAESELFDLDGSPMLPVRRAKDAGIGRVVAARHGCLHSFTLEVSFGATHNSDNQLTPRDLASLGRSLCRALRALVECETVAPSPIE